MAIYCYDPAPYNGRPILLLHGLGADGHSWGLQFPALIEAGFRPIAPDLPGFGHSSVVEPHWDIPSITALMADWLQGRFETPMPVAGLSMGGTIALQLTLTRPDLVNRLALVSTFAFLRPRHWQDLTYLLKRFLVAVTRGSAAQADMVAFHLFPNPDQADLRRELVQLIDESDPEVYRTAMRALVRFDGRRRLSEIHIPTMVISGALDSTVPVETQRELARGIPGAQHVIIPGARHAVIADQTARFNSVLLDFLQPAGQPSQSETLRTP